jgi:hypothetical protein
MTREQVRAKVHTAISEWSPVPLCRDGVHDEICHAAVALEIAYTANRDSCAQNAANVGRAAAVMLDGVLACIFGPPGRAPKAVRVGNGAVLVDFEDLAERLSFLLPGVVSPRWRSMVRSKTILSERTNASVERNGRTEIYRDAIRLDVLCARAEALGIDVAALRARIDSPTLTSEAAATRGATA